MAQQVQGRFSYRRVQLRKSDPLGTGSYGAVYKAMCDDLPCAGKILHPTLFQSNDPGAMTVMRRFQQECSFLSTVRHPNIVQYLGSYQDPDTRLPVLLMELMDDSLTRFLERSQEPLPYHTQVNLCHDIALALSYLHSNGIIHRDLSSNNVLLIAGSRAKVTDFGMAKVFDMSQSIMTPLTMCPGTLAYMSPEALDDPPVYTKKLDMFSFGVLDIQIITQQFPDPGPRTKKIRDPRSPTGRMEMPVLETERRKSHVDLIDSMHPLLPIAIDCLSYSEEDRPSAHDLCHRLAALKEASQYSDSVQQAQERSRPENTREDRKRQIMSLEGVVRERDERITLLEHQLQVVKDSEQRLKEKVDRERAQNRELMAAKSDSEGQFAVLQQRIKEQQDELEATSHEKLQMMEDERAALTEKLERNEDEKVALEGVVRERDEKITLLEHQLQVVKDSEQRLKEKVDRERAQNRELMAAKSDSEGQFAVLQQQIKEQQDEVEATSQEMSEKRDLVVFLNVQRSYPPHQDLQAFYQRDAELKPTSRDWVGLFRVGWSSSRDYYTFEWAFEWAPSAEETTNGSITFAGRRLPPEDGHFYQLCYVTREGTVRGMSSPFQFTFLTLLEQADLNSVMVFREECKVKEARVAELEGKLVKLQREYKQLEDKYDHKVHVKNDILERQQAALDEKVEEVSALQGEKAQLEREFQLSREERGKLEKTVVQLRRQIDSMRAREDGMRACPICNTKFSARMAQQEFERHVQGHFQD